MTDNLWLKSYNWHDYESVFSGNTLYLWLIIYASIYSLNIYFQLYHIEPGLRPVLIRDTPEEKTMELCRYSSTNRCNRGLECYFAHRYDSSE